MATAHQNRLPGADAVCRCTHNPAAMRYSVCPHVLRGSEIEVRGEPWPPSAPNPRKGLILCGACARGAASNDGQLMNAVESLLSTHCAECVDYHLGPKMQTPRPTP